MSQHEDPSMYAQRMATPEGREGLRRAREWADQQRAREQLGITERDVCCLLGTEADPQCVHCGEQQLTWVNDPAPDLCADCASRGLRSPLRPNDERTPQ